MTKFGVAFGWLWWETTRWIYLPLLEPADDLLDKIPGFNQGVELAYNQRVARQYRRIYRDREDRP